MSRNRVPRRSVLGMIGKTGIALSAQPLFVISLKTFSLLDDSLDYFPPDDQGEYDINLPKTGNPEEKVVISGSGYEIAVKISGPAGRYCAVAYATADTRTSYRKVAKSLSKIGRTGTCTIKIDTRNLPNQKVYLRIVTSTSSTFNSDVKGTRAFEVTIFRGRITQFGGVRERPMEMGEVARVAATCWVSRGS